MRAEFERLCRSYPKAPAWRDPGFTGHPVARLLRNELPDALKRALPTLLESYLVDGSAGDGSWTHTPWVAVLDPKVTTTVQEGVYVVYLLSLGGERLYLTLNQGCTRLKDGPAGIPGARQELARRREMIWRRLQPSATRMRPISVDLNVEPRVWRGKLYELGAVAGVEYPASALPSENEMAADLAEVVGLYRTAIAQGGWAADDDIEREALDDDVPNALTQAKAYRVHRSIERQASHSKLVKKVLGTRCMGCDLQMEAVYGPAAAGMVDAHHLTPLSSLVDGAVVTFDPRRDFAVLCPNCHRFIHRMPDSSDVEGLRKAVARGRGPSP